MGCVHELLSRGLSGPLPFIYQNTSLLYIRRELSIYQKGALLYGKTSAAYETRCGAIGAGISQAAYLHDVCFVLPSALEPIPGDTQWAKVLTLSSDETR